MVGLLGVRGEGVLGGLAGGSSELAEEFEALGLGGLVHLDPEYAFQLWHSL
jgi:hypothetical protein